MKKTNMPLVAALLATTISASHGDNQTFTNGGPTNDWSDITNWDGGFIADDNTDQAQINFGPVTVDDDYTIKNIVNRFAGNGGSAVVTVSPTFTLTIDVGSGTTAGITNRNGGDPTCELAFDGRVEINHSGAGNTLMNFGNSGNNSLRFASSSELALTTNLETRTGTGGLIEFNGMITGSGTSLRFNSDNVVFGATSDNSGFTGEFVLFGGSVVVANTQANNVFFGGSKIQALGTVGSSTLTLNNENVIANQPLVNFITDTSGTLIVNADQAFGNLNIANLDVTLETGVGVTELSFTDSSGEDWSEGGKLLIEGFVPGVIRFGEDSDGLTLDQLALIEVPGYENFTLDSSGYLIADQIGVTLTIEENCDLTGEWVPIRIYNLPAADPSCFYRLRIETDN